MDSRSDAPWCREADGARLATVRGIASLLATMLLVAACGDRAPPPLWPEPPPPTLAKPIGQEPPAADREPGVSPDAGGEPAGTAEEARQGGGDPPDAPPSDPESGAVSIDGSARASLSAS